MRIPLPCKVKFVLDVCLPPPQVNIMTENFALCFDGFFKTQTGGDCLVGPTASYVTLHIDSRNSKLESQVHQEVPSIKASMECSLEFFMEYTNTTSVSVVD